MLDSIVSNNLRVNGLALIRIRHIQELEADKYASFYMKRDNVKNYLPEALLMIIKPKYLNYSTPTHPATSLRVKRLKEYRGY